MVKWSSQIRGEETWRDVMEWRARIYPDKLAVCSPGTSKQSTFKELNQRVNSLTNALTDLGVKKGDRVAVLATDIPEYIEIASTCKAGNVYVPLNWRLKGQELTYIINDSGANTVFVEEQFCDTIRSIRLQLPQVKHFICIDGSPEDMLSYNELIGSYPSDDPDVEVVENDILTLLYTSGTTGLPKGVIRKHRDTLSHLRMMNEDGRIRNDDRCLCMMPLFHAAMVHVNFAFIMWGATHWLIKKFDPEAIFELVQREKMTWLAGVPTMFISLTEHPSRTNYDLSSLRYIAYIGSPMPVEALRRAVDVFGPIFSQGYGLSENTGETLLTAEDHLIALKEPGKERILFSVGKPLLGCQMRLVDDNDNDVPLGGMGEIIFHSDHIIEGYWNKPEETEQALKNGWLHTGDIGKLDEDGYLYIVDRKKDMIITGGENVYTREVEEVLYTHPLIAEAAVIGVPDPRWGEAIKAVVALDPGAIASEREIIGFCRKKIGGFKCPKSVDFIHELPKNPAGKILKKELKKRFSSPCQ